MKYVTFDDAQKIESGPTCTVYEYGGNNKIDGAIAEIKGRYPQTGWAMNTEVSEMLFVLGGEGELVTKERRFALNRNVLILLEKGESYYFESQVLRVFIACAPPWHPKQYIISKE